jgi:CheY-like chemotaxis protein
LDGYEIARRFRGECGARALLVALTGYGTPGALERSRHAGFDHHFIKPVNPDLLNEILSSDGCAGRSTAASRNAIAGGNAAASESIGLPSDVSLQ